MAALTLYQALLTLFSPQLWTEKVSVLDLTNPQNTWMLTQLADKGIQSFNLEEAVSYKLLKVTNATLSYSATSPIQKYTIEVEADGKASPGGKRLCVIVAERDSSIQFPEPKIIQVRCDVWLGEPVSVDLYDPKIGRYVKSALEDYAGRPEAYDGPDDREYKVLQYLSAEKQQAGDGSTRFRIAVKIGLCASECSGPRVCMVTVLGRRHEPPSVRIMCDDAD